MTTLFLVLDLLGTFVFALSGATAGVKRRLDVFGVLVLSFVVGNVGGITRDLLIGAVPPGGTAILILAFDGFFGVLRLVMSLGGSG